MTPFALYERWREIARDHRSQMALRETSSGRTWTFGELAASAETPLEAVHGIVFPRGNSAEFILTVLRAWRSGALERVHC